MVEKNIRLKTHLGNGVYDTLHPETNSGIVKVGNKNLDETLGEVTAQLAQTATELSTLDSDKAELSYVNNQLGQKANDEDVRKKAVKINPEDFSESALSLVTGGGTVNVLSEPADASVTLKKMATGVGAYQSAIYLNRHDYVVTKNGSNLVVKFPTGTSFYYRNTGLSVNVSLTQLEYTIPTNYALVLNVNVSNDLQINNITSLTTSDNILVLNNGIYNASTNLPSRQGKMDSLLYTNGKVIYEKVASILELDFTNSTKIYLRTGDNQNREVALTVNKHSITHGKSLVWNLYSETLVQRDFALLLPDDIVLIGNYNGSAVNNNIQAISEKSRVYVDDILHYAGTISVETSTSDLVVNFSDQSDKRLFFRTIEGNYSFALEKLSYTIPHNSSLVLNRVQSKLEIIQTNDFVRGVHWLLVLNHNGMAKMMNIKATEIKQNTNTEAKPRVPKEIYKRFISQDGCLVEDEVWLLTESDIPHTNHDVINRLDKDTFEEIGTISHNLGHGNSVDYRNGKLLVISGAPNAEICLYDNPIGKESLNFNDDDNTVITFKEGDNKTFNFDRTVVFGEDEKILYFVNREGVCKVLLGMGDNDLSDTTSDKSDGTRWGSFIQGKTEHQYNGTAQVLEIYKGFVFGATQCATYDGHLYVMNGFEDLKAYKVRLDDESKTYEIVDTYSYVDTDYKNIKKHWEPESIFFVESTLYLTGRTTTDGVIVGLNK